MLFRKDLKENMDNIRNITETDNIHKVSIVDNENICNLYPAPVKKIEGTKWGYPYAAGFPTFKIPFAEISNLIDTSGEFWKAFNF